MRLIPNIILPTSLTGVETIADAVAHYSLSIEVDQYTEKEVQVFGAITLGAPGFLLAWVELAPDDVAALYTLLGVASVLVIDGSLIIPWTSHSKYMRVAIQSPGAGVAATWGVTVYVQTKGPIVG